MSITSFPIVFGSTVWIRFVQTRDAMLRGERAAMVMRAYRSFVGQWCPVCGHGRIDQDTDIHNRRVGPFSCSTCWAEFEERQHHDDWMQLWVRPGQQFLRSDFPPLRHLPFSYPMKR